MTFPDRLLPFFYQLCYRHCSKKKRICNMYLFMLSYAFNQKFKKPSRVTSFCVNISYYNVDDAAYTSTKWIFFLKL